MFHLSSKVTDLELAHLGFGFAVLCFPFANAEFAFEVTSHLAMALPTYSSLTLKIELLIPVTRRIKNNRWKPEKSCKISL